MGVLFTAMRVSLSSDCDGQREWEGLCSLQTLYQRENVCACEYHVQKIGDLKKEKKEGREYLSPQVSGLGVSPVAGLLALLSSFPKLFVVPAEGYLEWLGVGGGGAAATRDAASSSRGVFRSE